MSDIQALQTDIANAKDLVERREMALRLSENRDFRKLFIEGYFRDDAARLVQLSGDPALDKAQREDALEMAKATGHAKRYLSMAIQMGFHASEELPQMEATLEEMRTQGEDDEQNEDAE